MQPSYPTRKSSCHWKAPTPGVPQPYHRPPAVFSTNARQKAPVSPGSDARHHSNVHEGSLPRVFPSSRTCTRTYTQKPPLMKRVSETPGLPPLWDNTTYPMLPNDTDDPRMIPPTESQQKFSQVGSCQCLVKLMLLSICLSKNYKICTILNYTQGTIFSKCIIW